MTLSSHLGADYHKSITRLQFAELAVNFVENISGNRISISNISFQDTADTAVIKAATAGIVQGTGNGTVFSPDSYITREEIATMIYRTIHYLNNTTLKSPSKLSEFCDAESISDWAVEPMGCLVATGILKGVSKTELLPKGNISIEQSVFLIYRSYAQMAETLTRPMAEDYADAQKSIQSDLQRQYSLKEKATVTFTKSKVTKLDLIEVYNDISSHPGTYLLFSLDYRLKPDHPENITIVGGLNIDETNWMTVGLPTTLVFKKELARFQLVGGFLTEFSPDGNNQIFRNDFIQWMDEGNPSYAIQSF